MRGVIKRIGKRATGLLVLGALLGAFSAAGAAPGNFEDFDGQPRAVGDYTGDGRWLMVMIWVHDCHVCNMEVEGYAQFHLERQDQDLRVLGLSIDGAADKPAAEAFIARHDVPFPNLIGEIKDVAAYFQSETGTPFRGTPSILLYDPQGTLRAAQAGAVPVTAIEAFIAQQSSP